MNQSCVLVCWCCCLLSGLCRPPAPSELDADALAVHAASRRCVHASLLVVARLFSLSLVLDSIPPMQQYFRVVCGQSTAFDDETNSSAVPVFASVSPVMSDGASGDSSEGRSAAASLSFARQMAAVTESLAAAQGVLSETAARQSSLATDGIAMNATLGQLVGVIGNLATQHGNVAAQVGSLVDAVTVTDNTANTAAATSRNYLGAMQALPDLGQALAMHCGWP